MDAEETRALWGKGEEAWNAWALSLLQRKQALEDSGGFSADWFGEGQNDETQAWLAEAKADFTATEFASDADFRNLVFPGPALFDEAYFRCKAQFPNAHFAFLASFRQARFDGEAGFKQAKFYHLAAFDDAVFASSADFEKAEFLRESTGPLVPAARFQKTHFAGRAEFRGSKFGGHCEFIRTRFDGNARLDEAEFQADASFENAAFNGTAGLVKARFMGRAKFDQAHFASEARFGEVAFSGPLSFEEVVFGGKTSFRLAQFGGEAVFDKAVFAKDVRIAEARFAETAQFQQTHFARSADFQKTIFSKTADFTGARFGRDADFGGVSFTQSADFGEVKFKGNASFSEAAFLGAASFSQTSFRARGSFRRSNFAGAADFAAVQSRGAFVLAGSRFAQVPSFQEASFREPPRLDYITIADPIRFFPEREPDDKQPRPYLLRGMKMGGNGDIAARYRRLRQFAADAGDYEREREFFAQELRARRFWIDHPFGHGLGRFWLGWLYGGLSDFGRSVGRPLLCWALTVPLFALVYLAMRRSVYFAGAPSPVATAAVPPFPSWPAEPSPAALFAWTGDAAWWTLQSFVNLFSGGGCIDGGSGATAEALFLSLKNSFFFLGWESPEAARRVYACLYGTETSAGETLARLPLSVSATAILQNMVGAFLLFLMLVAFRNLLKTR